MPAKARRGLSAFMKHLSLDLCTSEIAIEISLACLV